MRRSQTVRVSQGFWITVVVLLSNLLSGLTYLKRMILSISVSLPQSRFFVAEQFTGTPGKYVPLKETIRGFKEILAGKYDDLPESAFYMVGSIDEVVEAANKMKKEG